MFGLSIGGALTSLPYLGCAFVAALLYNTIENRSIVREARAGYVTEVQLATVQGQLAEVKRQADAAQKASDLFQEALVKLRTEDAANEAALEASIEKYKAESGTGDPCRGITDRDLEFLTKP